MQEMKQFRRGDRVRHGSAGDGVVVRADAQSVDVRYEHFARNGKQSVGVYDALWFRLHPALLCKAV